MDFDPFYWENSFICCDAVIGRFLRFNDWEFMESWPERKRKRKERERERELTGQS
jgi:hypothetical protein